MFRFSKALLVPLLLSLILASACTSSADNDADVMLVLDSSGSMSGQAANLKNSMKGDFLSHFNAERDRLGIIRFATGSEIVQPLSREATGFGREQVNAAIDAYTAGGWTSTGDAIRKATDELRAIPTQDQRVRAIVMFSDGAPNVVAAQSDGVEYGMTRTFSLHDANEVNGGLAFNIDPVQSMPTLALGGIETSGRLVIDTSLSACNLTRASINVAENAARIAREAGIVVHVIGLGEHLSYPPPNTADCGLDNSSTALAILRRLANAAELENPDYSPTQPAGLFCIARDAVALESCFTKVASQVK